MIHRLFIRRFGKSLGIKNKKTERYRTNRAKPTIERQKRGRKSGNRKPSRNRKNGAITDTPTPTIIRKSKCSTDFKRNDFLKKNEAYPLGALRSLKFAYRKLRISLFVELAV